MSEVIGAWTRIENQLRNEAPAAYRTLRAGATEAELADAEGELGVALPEGLRELWSLHDGIHPYEAGSEEPNEGLFLDGEGLLSVAQALLVHDILNRPDGWLPQWIPFTADDPEDPFCGLFLDAATGLVGSWNRQDVSEPADDPGHTLARHLDAIADALEQGTDEAGWNGA
ncbi:SMI1/KNR4 family protein [Streptomyces violascens]|uniref:SMI1/KNR4 family protein n=1 Tax=Streptomyces violascens TaxID=67381 RepID=UPI00365E77E8